MARAPSTHRLLREVIERLEEELFLRVQFDRCEKELLLQRVSPDGEVLCSMRAQIDDERECFVAYWGSRSNPGSGVGWGFDRTPKEIADGLIWMLDH